MQHKWCILRIQNDGVISHGNGKEVRNKEAFGEEVSFEKSGSCEQSGSPAEREKISRKEERHQRRFNYAREGAEV